MGPQAAVVAGRGISYGVETRPICLERPAECPTLLPSSDCCFLMFNSGFGRWPRGAVDIL